VVLRAVGRGINVRRFVDCSSNEYVEYTVAILKLWAIETYLMWFKNPGELFRNVATGVAELLPQHKCENS
jgi:hypothetical protein